MRVLSAGEGGTLLYLACARSVRPAMNRQKENWGFVKMGEKDRNLLAIVAISEAASRHVSAEDADGSLMGQFCQCDGG